MRRELLLLPALAHFGDLALLLLRWVTGAFLVWQSHDNIFSTARMDEFEAFLRKFNFILPELMAPLCVWAQFLCGLAFILGFATRWAGLVTVFVFVVAVDGPLAPGLPRLVAGAGPGLPRPPVCNPGSRALLARSTDREAR